MPDSTLNCHTTGCSQLTKLEKIKKMLKGFSILEISLVICAMPLLLKLEQQLLLKLMNLSINNKLTTLEKLFSELTKIIILMISLILKLMVYEYKMLIFIVLNQKAEKLKESLKNLLISPFKFKQIL